MEYLLVVLSVAIGHKHSQRLYRTLPIKSCIITLCFADET